MLPVIRILRIPTVVRPVPVVLTVTTVRTVPVVAVFPVVLDVGIVMAVWVVSRIPTGPIVLPGWNGMVVTVVTAAGVVPDTPDTQHIGVVSNLRVLPVAPATSV